MGFGNKNMEQTNSPQATPLAKRHMKAFWPLMTIFVVAAVFAGLIYWFEFNLSVDYDLNSLVISVHKKTDSTPTSKIPTKTTSSQTTTAKPK